MQAQQMIGSLTLPHVTYADGGFSSHFFLTNFLIVTSRRHHEAMFAVGPTTKRQHSVAFARRVSHSSKYVDKETVAININANIYLWNDWTFAKFFICVHPKPLHSINFKTKNQKAPSTNPTFCSWIAVGSLAASKLKGDTEDKESRNNRQ